MKNKNVVVKHRFKLCNFCNVRVVSVVSLLFLLVLVFSPLVSVFNGASFFVQGVETPDKLVGTETELFNAVSEAPSDKTPYVIGISADILLKETLEIPVGKSITLVSVGDGVWSLVGTTYRGVIGVAGLLTIAGVDVTHVRNVTEWDTSCGVYIVVGGEFILVSGKISEGDILGLGAGVSNRGTFVMLGGEISGNAAVHGGGVYNYDGGNFTMLGGKISNNGGGTGGGVYTNGTFTMVGGEIIDNYGGDGCGVYVEGGVFDRVGGVIQNNAPLNGGGANNVYYADSGLQDGGLFGGGWPLYFLCIVGSVAVVGGLFFYRSKRQNQSVTRSVAT